MKEDRYYSMTIEEIHTKLKTTSIGLTTKEVEKRIERDGLNELPRKKKESIISIFIKEIFDPIVLLLIAAIIISLAVGEKIDAIAITFIVLVDLILGTYQENKANSTIESLQKLVPEKVKVLRDEKEVSIDSKELVVGDLIFLESGDKISADLRIVESHNLTVDESILTGESLPVEKNNKELKNKEILISSQTNMLFAGCSVITGRAKCIVVKTGINTEVGQVAETINNTKKEKSPLTIRVEKFSKQITIFIIVMAIILFVVLYLKGLKLEEILVSVIALTVSVLPEGLPLALTMALTIASNRMARKKVVAKKLYSVEALGSCTVIASDKTGTLTVNEQTAKKILLPNNLEYIVKGEGYHVNGSVYGKEINKAKEIATLGVINNEAKFSKNELIGDSIDLAFLVLGEKLKVKTSSYEILEIIPYESQNKYSAVFYKYNNEVYCTVKGSLEVVSKLCNSINLVNSKDFKNVEKQNEYLSSDGYRVIAIANGKIKEKDSYKEEDIKNLCFMGLVGFIDPIRREVVKAIKDSEEAGIKVLMITGDHPLTAFKIAKDLKLTNDYDEVTTGIEVDEYLDKGKEEFLKFVRRKKIFSRVTPLQKLKIVEILKEANEFVAVTGDGVNDAPALQSANIGISMGSGTDIAKETSNMIVLDDNFKSIVKGIFEGRIAYANIRKITYFLVSCGLAEVLFYMLSIVFNMPMPLLAIQLLWLNVVTNGIQDIALSFEKGEPSIMKLPPRKPEESLFDRKMLEEILVSGLSIGLIVFLYWIYLIKFREFNVYIARGYVLVLMIIIQNIHAFNCRSEEKSISEINLFSNKIFLIGIMGSIILGVLVMEIPSLTVLLKTANIPLSDFTSLFAIGLLILLIMEIYKEIKRR